MRELAAERVPGAADLGRAAVAGDEQEEVLGRVVEDEDAGLPAADGAGPGPRRGQVDPDRPGPLVDRRALAVPQHRPTSVTVLAPPRPARRPVLGRSRIHHRGTEDTEEDGRQRSRD